MNSLLNFQTSLFYYISSFKTRNIHFSFNKKVLWVQERWLRVQEHWNSFLTLTPETELKEDLAQSGCPRNIYFCGNSSLIRNVDDHLRHKANVLEVCLKVSLLT